MSRREDVQYVRVIRRPAAQHSVQQLSARRAVPPIPTATMTQPASTVFAKRFAPGDYDNLSGFWGFQSQTDHRHAHGNYAPALKPLLPAGDPPPSLPPTPPSTADGAVVTSNSIKLGGQYRKAGTMTFSADTLSGFWRASHPA